jgi:pilus assembly protein CpaB
MRPKYVFALLLLLSLGVIGVLVVRAMPHKAVALAAAPAAPKQQILVATRPLPASLFLRAQDVSWRALPGHPQPGDIVRPSTAPHQAAQPRKAAASLLPVAHNASQAAGPAPRPSSDDAVRAGVYGAALRSPVAAGAPIRTTNIVKPGDRDFLDTVLQPGTRALTIPVTAASIGAGLMYPGDHVDVMLTQTFHDAAPLTRRSVSETVVEDLRVLAIEPNTRSVTLEVKPRQAEKINVALVLGKLSLSLRSLSEPAVASDAAPQAPQAPTWAGDVSPALKMAAKPPKAFRAEEPTIRVMRGSSIAVTRAQ